jgi:hypothetical protein
MYVFSYGVATYVFLWVTPIRNHDMKKQEFTKSILFFSIWGVENKFIWNKLNNLKKNTAIIF